MKFVIEQPDFELLKCRISELEDALAAADDLSEVLAERIEHRDGVIAALQQNIADLTAPQQDKPVLKMAKLPRYF